jgi:hypothetical protein
MSGCLSRLQIDAMYCALTRAYASVGPPLIELAAIRIMELAREGEFDPDKLTATVVAEFGV